jgi:hypothetical protein
LRPRHGSESQTNNQTGLCQTTFDRHRHFGYEIAKGQYLVVEDEELERIEIESTHVIEIDSFVPRQEIDQRFFDTPYYVTPNEPVAQETFAVIREKKGDRIRLAAAVRPVEAGQSQRYRSPAARASAGIERDAHLWCRPAPDGANES